MPGTTNRSVDPTLDPAGPPHMRALGRQPPNSDGGKAEIRARKRVSGSLARGARPLCCSFHRKRSNAHAPPYPIEPEESGRSPLQIYECLDATPSAFLSRSIKTAVFVVLAYTVREVGKAALVYLSALGARPWRGRLRPFQLIALVESWHRQETANAEHTFLCSSGCVIIDACSGVESVSR
jgi:hypothetical protein